MTWSSSRRWPPASPSPPTARCCCVSRPRPRTPFSARCFRRRCRRCRAPRWRSATSPAPRGSTSVATSTTSSRCRAAGSGSSSVTGWAGGGGLRAAAVMGQLRAAVRSYSLEGHPPASLLARLDLLVGTLEEGMLVTAVYGEWDPGPGLVLLSCAGHLPPLVRLPGREPELLELDPGLPLGVGAQDYVEAEIALPPGSLLLGFTDGLVEGKDLPVEEGMAQLLAAMNEPRTAMEACDAALAALRPLSSTRKYDDDTALLALVAGSSPVDVKPSADSDMVVMVELPADATSPARARSVVADVLRRWQLPHLVDPATLLVSELVTNGVRHAGTGMRLTLTRQTFVQVRIAVTDKAPTADLRAQPKDDTSESGRGLFLVEHLSTGWGSAADDRGKTVWFELNA